LGEPESLDVLNYTMPIEVVDPFSTSKTFKVMKAAAGKTHSLVLTDDGTLFSFGFGMGCGHGASSMTGIPEPVQYLFRFRIVDCAAGEYHSAAVTDEGKLFTWGLNNRRKPVMVRNKELDTEVVTSVSCGVSHGFALTASGKLFGYGKNDNGQVKDGAADFICEESIQEVKHPADLTWVQVSCGLKHTIALDSTGSVYVWGGIRTTAKESVISKPTKIDLSGITTHSIRKVMSGYSSFAILTVDGKLFTWGYNMHFNLGHGHDKFVEKPTNMESVNAIFVSDIFMGAYNMFVASGLGATTDYAKLLHETCYYADVIVRASNGDEKIAHSCILSARSPYLAALLFRERLKNHDKATAKFLANDNKHISTVLALNFVEDLKDLEDMLNLVYTNISIGIRNAKKFDSIVNDHLYSLDKAVEILQKDCNIETEHLEYIKKNMFHENVSTVSGCVSGNIKEYVRDFVNLYSSTAMEEVNQNSLNYNYSDVVFQLDDGSVVRTHKAILCARSPYFRAMFSAGSFIESFQKEITIDNIQLDVFNIMLKYIYTGEDLEESDLTAEQSVPLLELTTRFDLQSLKVISERKIIKYLDPTNVVAMLAVSDLCQAENVKKCCVSLIARYFSVFKKEELEQELDASLLEEIETLRDRYELAASRQEQNEQEVFEYMKLQKEAFEDLLDGDRQHLVNEYGEGDMEVIETILHGKHNPNAPVHAQNKYSHSTTSSHKWDGIGKQDSEKKQCLFM